MKCPWSSLLTLANYSCVEWYRTVRETCRFRRLQDPYRKCLLFGGMKEAILLTVPQNRRSRISSIQYGAHCHHIEAHCTVVTWNYKNTNLGTVFYMPRTADQYCLTEALVAGKRPPPRRSACSVK